MSQTDTTADLTREDIVQRNRLPTRAYFELEPENQLCLNGLWKFSYHDSPQAAIASDADKSDCSIQVPGHWQLQGFGKPHYTNVIYPFPVCPPYVPTNNPTGNYVRDFQINESWIREKQVRLRFDGVDSAFHVYVNDKSVGYSEGSRNPAEFDITSCCRPGSNRLLVRVYQWCDASYIEDQDQWWLSGIFRDVHLVAFPSQARIEDFKIQTELQRPYIEANISISLQLHSTKETRIDWKLTDQEGASVANGSADTPEIRATVDRPHLWSAEDPYLYHLQMNLFSDNKLVQSIHQEVGVRVVEMLNGNICVNGVPVLFKGVNRHDHHPQFGRAVPLDYIWHDLLLMKRNNVNALRTSHYPSHPKLYEFCDRLGLWVMDEADLECHGFYEAVLQLADVGSSPSYDEKLSIVRPEAAKFTSDNLNWRTAYVDRMQSLVHRDKNRPSVICWSLGNEAFYGINHKAMYDWSKKYDPSRPVHYEGDRMAESADMFSYMYPSVNRIKKLATEEGDDFQKPIVLCEYGHAMGNGPGGLEEYQQAFYQHRRLQGGFIWEWANHGLEHVLKDGTKEYAYGGDFGDYPNDSNFVMDGLLNSEHQPGPGVHQLRKTSEPIRTEIEGQTVHIKNMHQHVDMSHILAEWKVRAIDKYQSDCVATGNFDLPQVAPGEEAIVPLPNFDSPKECDYWLYVSFRLKDDTLWAAAGHEVASAHYQLKKASADAVKQFISDNLQTARQGDQLTITGNDFTICFNETFGKITEWTFKGTPIINSGSGPALGFWRAVTDNDRPKEAEHWKSSYLHSLQEQIRGVDIKTSPHSVEITVKSRIAPPVLLWGFECETLYQISESGSIRVVVKFQCDGKTPDTLPRVGLDLQIPGRFAKVDWYGLGPGQSYSDMKGYNWVDVHSSSVEDLFYSFDFPQDNGNRSEVRRMRLQDGGKICLGVSSSRLFNFSVMHYSVQNLDNATHPHELQKQDCVFLHLDHKVQGLGTGSCGPGCLPQYQLKCKDTQFDFTLSPECSNK